MLARNVHRRDLRLREVKGYFVEHGTLPPEGAQAVRGEVLRSWTRCLSARLLPSAAPARSLPAETALRESRASHQHFLSHSRGILSHLCQQIRASSSLVAVADSRGMILECHGDPDFIDLASQVSLAPGALWDEELRGTNAIATALVEDAPVEILGSEHFLDCHSFLASCAAPVHDPAGRQLGAINIASHFRVHQRHALGLVKLATQMVERRLFEAEYRHRILVALHPQMEAIGTLQEGLLAFSPEGALQGANPAALGMLGCRRQRLGQLDFELLFTLPFAEFMDRAGRDPHSLLALPQRDGGRLYGQLRNDGGAPRPATLPRAMTEASPRPAAGRRAEDRTSLEGLDTGDPELSQAIARAKRIVGKDIPLLILGESGVGKEMFATAFHGAGPRRAGPFVALNCAAIPESLIESELFGYVGGAFTGARREGYTGKIQQAGGGTLFLDEIGDMPLNLQARLLRVLQERTVTPLGGGKAVPVDISLVCATHHQLPTAVKEGRFRQDLYYRINGLTVTLPPLRRRQDIRRLAAAILCQEAGDGKPVVISEAVFELFGRYPWPGNLRQMQNVLRVALALLDAGQSFIGLEHLPEELLIPDAPLPHPSIDGEAPVLPDPPAMLADIEFQAVERVLKECNGNVSAAARSLGISRNTLYRKLGRM